MSFMSVRKSRNKKTTIFQVVVRLSVLLFYSYFFYPMYISNRNDTYIPINKENP